MIREATEADIPRLLEMGRAFADRARLDEHVGYDPASMQDTFRAMIGADHCIILIGERGTIGALRERHPFNRAHIMASEVFWFSQGREGLRLLAALEAWAEYHCHSLRMITLEAVEPARTGALYERRGFRPLEHGYVKVY